MRGWMIGLAALAVFAGGPAGAQDVAATAVTGGTVLEITVEGHTTRVPDLAVITAGVTTQAPTAAQAFTQNGTRMAKVIAALRAAGVAERDIQTSSIQLTPQYRDRENQSPVITAYQASNSVTVRFRDVSRAGPILDVLVREGANTVYGPNLMLSQPDAAMDEARVDAVARARARAELYAKAAGMRVDRILSIADVQSSMMLMMQNAPPGIEPDRMEVIPGERAVTAIVTIRFLLK